MEYVADIVTTIVAGAVIIVIVLALFTDYFDNL